MLRNVCRQSVFKKNVFNPALNVALMSTKPFRGSTALGNLGYELVDEIQRPIGSMTKMVITVGPASDPEGVVEKFVEKGLRVMRMNFSHAFYDEAKGRLDRLRLAKGSHIKGSYLTEDGSEKQVTNTRAALLDTKGPEVRTGVFKSKIVITKGTTVILTTDPAFKEQDGTGEVTHVFVDFERLSSILVKDDVVLLDDGGIGLDVIETPEAGSTSVRCVAKNTGKLGSRKGVNMPGKSLDLPPLTEKDKEDLKWGVENDVDFVAQSFVTKASDVLACKSHLADVIESLKNSGQGLCVHDPGYYPPKVIAKIESAEALDNFDEILQAADGIMVARGDLGVEIPFRKVTLAQKMMVRKCNEAGKPVIVATQMLESMQANPRPTRAEVSDVTNAVIDGADAVMLSGESANGEYPVESVETMQRIVKDVDEYILGMEKEGYKQFEIKCDLSKVESSSAARQEAVCAAAVEAANLTGAKLIIVLVRGGTAARLLAKYRPTQPIMAFCLHPKTARQLSIHRGVYPVVGKGTLKGEKETGSSPFRNFKHGHENPKEAIAKAKEIGWIERGDKVVVVSAEKGDTLYSSSLGMHVLELK